MHTILRILLSDLYVWRIRNNILYNNYYIILNNNDFNKILTLPAYNKI